MVHTSLPQNHGWTKASANPNHDADLATKTLWAQLNKPPCRIVVQDLINLLSRIARPEPGRFKIVPTERLPAIISNNTENGFRQQKYMRTNDIFMVVTTVAPRVELQGTKAAPVTHQNMSY